jgi:uncharacterized protein YigE (DUF2233 family)
MAVIRSSLLLLVLALAACGEPATENAPAPRVRVRDVSACEQRVFEDTLFIACRYDRRRDRIEFFLDGQNGPLRSFAGLERQIGPRVARLRFAMNAGMYGDDGRPIGLYVEDGRQRRRINRSTGGHGNFHMQPNGVFTVAADGSVAVLTSDRYDAGTRPRWATQSGPMLVIGGHLHPMIQDNGPSLHIRNGVGVDSPDTAWFVISGEPVSFGRLARFFRDALGCADALYLDGSVSSLWDGPAHRQDRRTDLGPFLAVFEREGRD